MNSFAQFIEEFTVGDINLQRCIQEQFGCILTNNLRHQKCLFFYGSGNNGKSILINLLIKAITIDYLNNIIDLTHDGTDLSNWINDAGIVKCSNLAYLNYETLINKKLCIIEEADDIANHGGTIKSLLGGDMFLYENAGKLLPMFNKAYLILISNNEQDLDELMNRRVVKIPCLAKPEPDHYLLEKLSDINIINEMIEWMKEGDARVRQQGFVTKF